MFGFPLVCFVDYPSKKPTDEKLSFAKTMFSKSVTNSYGIFITNDMEAAIKLVMIHETILADLKPKDQAKAN